MFDKPICANCKHWDRKHAQSGICNNEKSEMFERVVYLDHVCRPPFEGKY
jgi:hypothetical protein